MFALHKRTVSQWSNSYLRAICVVIMGAIIGSPGKVARSDERPAKDGPALLAVALDESRSYTDRFNALQDARHLSSEAKLRLFLGVIRNADDRVALASGFTAIRDGIHTPDIVDAVRARIFNWTLRTGPGIVQGLVHEGLADAASAQAVSPIVREVLQLAARRKPPSDPHHRELAVIEVNWSAFALMPQGTPADGKLFRAALRVYPEAHIAWVAAYKLRAMDVEMQELARSVYTDDARNNVVRVAAAIALQDEDKQAGSFALAAVRAYLEEFGGRSAEDLFPPNIYKADIQMRASYYRMVEERILVALLGFLKGDDSRELILSYLNSPNKAVGEFVRLVAARRWPDEVKARLEKITPDARVRLLATIEFLHLGSELPAPPEGLTSEEWNAIKKEIQRNLFRPQAEDSRLALEW